MNSIELHGWFMLYAILCLCVVSGALLYWVLLVAYDYIRDMRIRYKNSKLKTLFAKKTSELSNGMVYYGYGDSIWNLVHRVSRLSEQMMCNLKDPMLTESVRLECLKKDWNDMMNVMFDMSIKLPYLIELTGKED